MALSLSSQRRLSGAAEGCTSSRRAHATPAAALLRRRAPRLLVRASAVPNDPARVVPLPGAVWFLDALQDQFYDVHGPSFVIHRAETSADGDSLHKHKPGSKRPLPAPLDPMQAIRHAMRTQPMSMMLLADNVVDVEVEGVEEARPGEAGAGVRSLVWVPPAPVVAPNHTETGMIHVPSEEPEDDEGAEGEVFVSTSPSPRRTKMLRFVCMANGCRAVNIKPMNPLAFNKGTAFAQCAGCNKWHLIKDHLKLFNQLKKPVYVRSTPLDPEAVPPSLRLRPEHPEVSEHDNLDDLLYPPSDPNLN